MAEKGSLTLKKKTSKVLTQTLCSVMHHTWCIFRGQMDSGAPRQATAASVSHALCHVVNWFGM